MIIPHVKALLEVSAGTKEGKGREGPNQVPERKRRSPVRNNIKLKPDGQFRVKKDGEWRV